jgi:hypothetical protein
MPPSAREGRRSFTQHAHLGHLPSLTSRPTRLRPVSVEVRAVVVVLDPVTIARVHWPSSCHEAGLSSHQQPPAFPHQLSDAAPRPPPFEGSMATNFRISNPNAPSSGSSPAASAPSSRSSSPANGRPVRAPHAPNRPSGLSRTGGFVAHADESSDDEGSRPAVGRQQQSRAGRRQAPADVDDEIIGWDVNGSVGCPSPPQLCHQTDPPLLRPSLLPELCLIGPSRRR